MNKQIESTLTIPHIDWKDLRPEHCDALEAAALQNGDTNTLAIVNRARKGWTDDQMFVAVALTQGYAVFVNEFAGQLKN